MKCRGLRKKGDETEPYSNSTCEKSESDYIWMQYIEPDKIFNVMQY
jgi:hypothetical protein